MTQKTGNSAYGTETLEVISEAGNFNRWMYETIRPLCRGKILEIGSGIGNISRFFIEEGASIALSDFDSSYFSGLEDTFKDRSNLLGIYRIDLSDPNIGKNHRELINQFDTVFALNVVEHIDDHEQALINARKLLRPGGRVIILVPAFHGLYNDFDRQLGHYRRYTSGTLRSLVNRVGFKVIYARYFNFIGMLGWIFSGSILRKKMIPGGQMKIYNALVPVWKVIDLFTRRFSGISVIVAGEKPGNRKE